ncbi:MAG TPA: hydantoinase/oxoprolinase family protein [Gaiellaceae bacterium]|nr:hydantoinase/oxoprolinase family protein [Gaiellaceae bacterium]
MGASVGVDVGGTFTDLVAVVDGKLVTAKVPSVPGRQAAGVSAALAASGVGAVDVLAHGTTVATNALLERRGARTALVTTEGFRDVIEIGRQARASLYDLTAHGPPPLVPRELRFTVRERMGPAGVLVPLDEESLRAAVDALERAEVEAVAVCLLFSFLHPEHELRVGEAVREALPGARVSLSAELLPELREYERCSMTVANAYLAPALAAYLDELEPAPLVMQSSGGVVDAATAAERPAACVLSGPAAGVAGAAFVAALGGFEDVLTFDMGGTSTDVAAVLGGEAVVTSESVVAGVPIRFPMVDVHTIGAGGGSIAWLDDGGALRVGPRSAGAQPGPACYGRGGQEPTATDANLVLGYLADGAVLGGEVVLDRSLAEAALARIPVDESARKRSMAPDRDRINPVPSAASNRDRAGKVTSSGAADGVLAVAEGIVRVVNANMARALRVVSVERGIDPRGLALVAFGGAGPLHACALAEELGIARVLVPRASGVLSALGLAVADLRRDYVGRTFEELEAHADLPGATLTRYLDMRYPGQAHELTIEAGADFHAAHEQRYGFRLEAEPEVVVRRLVATVRRPRPELRARAAAPARGTRRARLAGEWRELAVHGPGGAVTGPAIVELPEATCLVRPGWAGDTDPHGTLVLERSWTP